MRAEVGTDHDRAVLEQLDWEPQCDMGRKLVPRDGSTACQHIARVSAVVHRCARPGQGLLVLLCEHCCEGYLRMAAIVARHPYGACSCTICETVVTPEEVIHNVQRL